MALLALSTTACRATQASAPASQPSTSASSSADERDLRSTPYVTVTDERLQHPDADGNLYVTTGNNDAAIRRIPNAGGEAEALANGQRPAAVVVDDVYAYWTDPPRGEIRRVPR